MLSGLVGCLSLVAQSWCPPGAQWIYDVGSPWITALEQFTYSGDTIVDGYPAQRIDRVYQQTSPMNVVASWNPFFTRTNGDVVWEWNGTEWDTLYWFSAVPGDHWQPFWPNMADCPDHAWLVLDTSTTVVSGIPLRTLLLELTELGVSTGQQPLTIRERFGGGGGFGFPGNAPSSCGGVYECYCTFGCYQDQDIVPVGGPCALSLSAPTLMGRDQGLQVFPNPVSDVVTIVLPDRTPMPRVEVLGMDGRLVMTLHPDNGTSTFPLTGLNAGLYLIRAFGHNGTVRTATVAVQHGAQR